jgi:hypothetical protein
MAGALRRAVLQGPAQSLRPFVTRFQYESSDFGRVRPLSVSFIDRLDRFVAEQIIRESHVNILHHDSS